LVVLLHQRLELTHACGDLVPFRLQKVSHPFPSSCSPPVKGRAFVQREYYA
jgi:hypothetical protein